MKRIAVSCLIGGLLVASVLLLQAQTSTTSNGSNATPLLSSVFQAAFGGTPVKSIQLSGNATWQVGSEVEQETVTASADDAGNSSLQLSGGVTRVETKTAIGPGTVCQWSGADDELHSATYLNCMKPIEWLLPALTLQPGLTPASAGFADLGISAFSTGKLRHLQAQLVAAEMSANFQADAMRRSTMDLGIDPATSLPSVLTYHVYPDNGAALEIAVEIRYSDYRKIGNAEIPFHIQRYINGALQLDIQVTSATLS